MLDLKIYKTIVIGIFLGLGINLPSVSAFIQNADVQFDDSTWAITQTSPAYNNYDNVVFDYSGSEGTVTVEHYESTLSNAYTEPYTSSIPAPFPHTRLPSGNSIPDNAELGLRIAFTNIQGMEPLGTKIEFDAQKYANNLKWYIVRLCSSTDSTCSSPLRYKTFTPSSNWNWQYNLGGYLSSFSGSGSLVDVKYVQFYAVFGSSSSPVDLYFDNIEIYNALPADVSSI